MRILSILLFIVIACNPNDKNDSTESPLVENILIDENGPELIGELILPIDSMTPKHSARWQNYIEDSVEYLFTLNVIEPSFIVYPIESPDQNFKIKLEREGPNGVSTIQQQASGFYVHNFDSIFLFNYYTENLYIINSKSEIIDRFRIKSDYNFNGEVLRSNNLWMKNGKVYLPGNVISTLGRPGMTLEKVESFDKYLMVLDLETREASKKLTYPEIYKSRGFMGQDYMFYFAWNKTTNEQIISYPVMNEVLITKDFESFDNREIALDGYENLLDNYPAPASTSHMWLQASRYGQIYYDPYHELYFRYFKTGIPESQIEEHDNLLSNKIKKYYAIYDNNFRFKYTWDVSNYRGVDIFFGKKGVYIGKDDGMDDEDSKTYLIFNFSSI